MEQPNVGDITNKTDNAGDYAQSRFYHGPLQLVVRSKWSEVELV